MAVEIDAVGGVIRPGQRDDVVIVAGVDERVAEDECCRRNRGGSAGKQRADARQ